MKKLLTVFFIIVVLLPMVVYLHPFVWGLRKPPNYEPSNKTKELILKLNKKYGLDASIQSNSDTLWYFIDVRNSSIKQLHNFKLIDYGRHRSEKQMNQNILKYYTADFIKEFEHKQYFDSIIIVRDTLIYKAKIQ